MQAHVVGRGEQLRRLNAFVDALPQASGSMVIAGEAGIGKTTLWQAALDAAVAGGVRVLAGRPAQSETSLAYSGLSDLLAQVDRAAFDALPEPQRRALEIALLLVEPSGRAPEPRAIFAAFGAVLRVLAAESPLIVGVDDLQWLDGSSLRAVEFVARRLGEDPIGILVTIRADASSDPSPVKELPDAARIEVGALSPAALHGLIKERLGVSLLRPSVLRVHREARGNPLFALELARVLIAAGLPPPSAAWPVPEDLREVIAARVAVLPKATRLALLRAAATGRTTISGVGAPSLRAAERAGIVVGGQSTGARFAHPLYAAGVYQSATDEERRRVHLALAREETDAEEQARHFSLASTGADESVAELLDRAAAQARARGAPDLAAELAERAAALTPAGETQLARGRRLAAAEHHFHAGDLERARSLLVALLDESEDGPSRSRLLRLLGEVCLNLNSFDEGLGYLREAVAAAGRDAAADVPAELELWFALTFSFGSFAEAAEAADRALAAACELEDGALLASALAVSTASELLFRGAGLDEARLEQALALEDLDVPCPLERRPSFLLGLVLASVDELPRARDVLGALRDGLVERGEENDLPDVLALLARVECLTGKLAAAAVLADRGFELAVQAGSDTHAAIARAMRALIDAHAGRVEATRGAAEGAIALAAVSGSQIAAFVARSALGLLELSVGNDAAVVATLAHSIALVEENGLVEPSRVPLLPDAIEALVGLGELDRAESLTRLLEERGRVLDRPSAIVSGARCRALVLAARGDVADALAAVERGLAAEARLPVPLEVARTLIVKGQLERRRKQKRQSRASLERALTLCEQIGAALWAERARGELSRLGRGPDPYDLTATEERVARLAASGRTNREIAATAFISQKTVEANLSRVYRKLGVRSRAELGLSLVERDREDRSRVSPDSAIPGGS